MEITDGWKSILKITAPNLKINGIGTFNSIIRVVE